MHTCNEQYLANKVKPMRLFIAIQLSDEMKRMVMDVQDTFRYMKVRGNYSPSENLHVTLAFIGEYSNPDAVLEAMERVKFSAFNITMDRVGCFGDLWWTGLEESQELETLAKNLHHALADAGIPYDKKKFKPHVTFLRKPDYSGGQRISHLSVEPKTMTVTSFSLMQSTRGKNGMIYTELGSVAAES